jgi:hypothetical protein
MQSTRLSSRFARLVSALVPLLIFQVAYSDEPVAPRAVWDGRYDYVVTGATLAADTDADGNVDSLVQPTVLPLPVGHWPGSASVVRAILYWGGTQTQPASGNPSLPDSVITLGLPGGDSAHVRADVCMFSDGGAASYDVWICRSDITHLLGSTVNRLGGSWIVSGYQGLVNDNASDHATVALVLVVSDGSFPVRHVTLFDGNQTLQSSADTLAWSAPGAVASGSLTFYTLEGDPGSSSSEKVVVTAPGGPPLLLSDPLNPVNNPMNQTINTTLPVQTGTIGIDIDRFAIDSALSGNDSSAQVIFSAGSDKWWLAAFVLAGELAEIVDLDFDGVPDSLDNCPSVPNPSQLDFDGDLFGAACDCNDADPAVHPGVTDLCNGKDDDCNGVIDPGCCPIVIPGDCDLSGKITSSDIIKLVNFIYRSGPPPLPCLANGDVDCDGSVRPEDVVYEVTYVFKGGQAPCDVCNNSSVPCLPQAQ